MQGRGHRAYQPVFQNAHTSDTAFIEVDPVLHQGLDLNVQGHLLEEREEDALEVTAVLLLRELVARSEEHTSELQSLAYLVCRLLLEKKKKKKTKSLDTYKTR